LNIVSFLITMTVFLVWIILFCFHGFNFSYVPFLGSKCQEVVGVVMFNFAFVTTIPSWINIKVNFFYKMIIIYFYRNTNINIYI